MSLTKDGSSKEREPRAAGDGKDGASELQIEHAIEDIAAEAGAEDAHDMISGRLEERPANATPVVIPKPPINADAAGIHHATQSGVWPELLRLLRTLRYSKNRRTLFALTVGLLAVIVAYMVAQVRLNTWNGAFFDAVEQKDLGAFGEQLVIFIVIIAVLLTLVVAQTWLQETMKYRIREWLVQTLLDEWLVPGRAYRLGMTSTTNANPDQRIQEDTRVLTELSTELGVGVVQSALMLVSFMGILWVLSDQVVFRLDSGPLVIPGYMVWCAIAYAALGSSMTWWVGAPLIGLNSSRYAREAEFRFALVRVSESAESVALYGGEEDERRQLDDNVGAVIEAMRKLSGALSRLMWITSGYGWLLIVVPIIVAAPGYFGGDLSFGGLMMVVGAFTQVQQALNWFVTNFPKIADWRSAISRVSTFHHSLDHVDDVEDEHERITLANHPRGILSFEHVGILLADGSVVIDEATAEIRRGERVLIKGESGSGKSTLFRAIAGLWPWGTGKILLPPRHMMEFMPQRPYLPLGTLRGAVTYPAGPEEYDADDIQKALERVGLAEFVPMLDNTERWDKAMSLGQQQRLAFARLLLHRPLWVFLDEATAALDDENQQVVMSVFEEELPDTTIISIGHRPGLEAFHTRTLQLVPSATGAHLQRKQAPLYVATDRLLTRMFRMRGRLLARRSGGRPQQPPM